MRKIYSATVALIVLLATAGAVLAAGGRAHSTTLSGAEEVSSTGVPGAGDPDGTGFASLVLNQGRGEVCFEITVANIDEPVTRAHIHAAPAGSNGGIAVALVEPGQTPYTFSNGVASGCVLADPELIKAIRQNPEAYYVNVHNVTFPGGAVRGQLGD